MEPNPSIVEALQVEMTGSEFSRHPQAVYAKLREHAPVIVQEGSVTVSRHEDVMAVLRDSSRFSSDFGEIGLGNENPLIPLQIDPPEHKKYRKILDPIFAPREVAKLEGDVVALVNELIDQFQDRGGCEFNGDFAVPLPCTVFLRLLGLPYDDLDLFLGFKDSILRPTADPSDLEGGLRVREAAAKEMYAYFDAVLDARERDPRDDIMSHFLRVEVEGDKLSREEIREICFLFLIAGLDTVTDALDCSWAFLAQNAQYREQIATDPAIVPSAVEELLRWETVVPTIVRVAASDSEISGCPVHEGDMIAVLIGSANTDGEAIARADRVDLARDPNPHITFGAGIHRCLGSHLARLELRTAFREWHRRIPDYRIADGVELEYTPALRQVENLPLTWDA